MANKKDLIKHNRIIELAKLGFTFKEIGNKIGVTKQRISQIINLNSYEVNPIKIRQELRLNKLKKMANNVKNDLKLGLSIDKIRIKNKLNASDITQLNKIGVDIRKVKKEEIKKRREKCLKLYKKGLTGEEIKTIIPNIRTVDDVYRNICDINNGFLPKRINSRRKKANKIEKEILKLKNKYSFYDLHAKLVEKGFKNLNGGELKLGSVMNTYYRKLK